MTEDTVAGLPTNMNLTLRVLTSPAELNYNQTVFGGWIMARVDEAAGVEAVRVCQGRCTTVKVDQFIFKQPVFVDDLLSFFTSVERIGNSSVVIHTEVWAQRGSVRTNCLRVTEAKVTYVAVDENGRPRPIPRA